jgi:Flp pilus assembly protein TadG
VVWRRAPRVTAARDPQVRPARRASGDTGAALVEFAFVMNILFLFLYGIIGFGLLLSFRQNLVQSAAEGARAGAVAPNSGGTAQVAALTAVGQSVDAYGRTCAGGVPLKCETSPAGTPCDPALPVASGGAECITVTLTYDHDADPLLPQIPLISQFLPSEIKVSSTAQMNPAP